MNKNKKYAIRKLAVGVASVSIGLFVSNVVDSSLLQNFKTSEVAKAADEKYNFQTIYTNDQANGEVDENGTNNNAVTKIEISDTPYHERVKRLRFTLKDNVDVSNGIVFSMVGDSVSLLSEEWNLYEKLISSSLYLNEEKIGEIKVDDSNSYKNLSPEKFTSFDEFYKKLTSLKDEDSSNFYVNKKITFNENFNKYNKNRVVEFNIFLSEEKEDLIRYDSKKNPDLDKIEKLKKIKKEFNHNIYFNKKEIKKTDIKYDFKLGVEPLQDFSVTDDDSKYIYDENSNVSFHYLGTIAEIKNPPAKIEKLLYYYKVLTKENIARKTPTKTNKVFLKKGTTFKFNINPQIFEMKNTQQNNEVVELTYAEKPINDTKTEILYFWQNEAFLSEKIQTNIENKTTKKVKLKYNKISDSEISYELLEDLLISSSDYEPDFSYADNLINNLRLKQDFIDNVDLSKYKKIFTTTNSTELKEIMEEIFSPISITIQEPGKQAIVGEASLSDYSLIKNSTTGEVGKGTIKVKYLNENKKEIKAEDKVIEDREWNSVFEITPQKIEGYEFLESSGPLKDIVGDGARTITLTYKTIEKNKTIPFNTIYKEDNTKEKGMQEIEREGENGLEAYSEVDSDYSRVIKEKIDRIVKVGTKQTTKVERLPSPVRYEKDSSREKGQENITVKGKDGSKTTTTTYTVNDKTGSVVENVGKPVVVNPTETVVKVAAKDKVSVEKLSSPVRYEKDNLREKGQENITIKGKDGSKTTTTTYTVNDKTGEVVETVGKPVVVEPTETVVKVAAKDKIMYSKDGDNVIKETTTYNVNPKTGEITETRTREVFKENGAKDKVVVEKLPSPVRYEKDNSREKGQENITVKGKDGSKTTTTTYTVNPKTGEVVETVGKPVVVESTETVVKVASKDKVEVVNKKDGETIKITTSYEVNPKTGEIKEVKKEELLSKKGIPEVSEESTEFKGGVNPSGSIVREDLPELKLAIIKDKENNVLDVIKEDEEPKEIKGYKNTGKTEADKDGHKVYIYEKVEESKSTPKENKVENTNKEEDNKESKKEVISKKEELPKTSASMLSTVGLFSIFGLRKNRKKDK